ncbi:protein phosphatase 1 regulatory subunit 21 [Gigaspora margarita]|uniref:Protein phosphatase 1 regulatory subunit 21 n=1 Tax=Gigaspora margarita TaxID=4874 RepID=A0A8H3X8L9_GIGMA|nr:protein phosphatase 1 regulatory subunit 21 [Gigaspora margarita]
MSDGRHSTSSLQSSGVTSAEELSEKYQKLFSEFSRMKAQHSVLKKAVIKEQKTISSLQDECKTKEQELRTSLQQLDLLTFHNQRLTKRIESLQDSSAARLSPGWLVGSAKKELEKSKVTLEATSIELNRKIEENEKLHKELYEVNSLYTQHVNTLQSKISELERKTEELQIELTRSHLASEEALSIIRQEKRDLDNELDQTRSELRKIKSLMEKNEQKLKEGDDVLQSEVIVLRDTLDITLGLSYESQIDQFNALREKIDNESNELIESFNQLQSNARDYLKSLKEKADSSYELGLKVKNASLVWQQNLQKLVVKMASAQNRITELTAEKENLIKANESDSNKIKVLEDQISQLKEELDKQKVTYNGLATEMNQHQDGNNIENAVSNNEVASSSVVNGLNEISSNGVNHHDTLANKDNSEVKENDTNITSQQLQEENDDDDDDNESFVYPNDSEKRESTELSDQPIKDTSRPTALTVMTTPITSSTTDDIDINASRNGNSNILELERDIGRVTKSESDARKREALIKNHYESKINQLTEQLQLSDSKSVRLFKATQIIQGKLAEADEGKLRAEQEKIRLQNELELLKDKMRDEQNNFKRQIDEMTGWIGKQQETITAKERQINELMTSYE